MTLPLTIIWISVEAIVSLSAAWIARSPALLAFGGDSAIELISAVVVLWRFKTNVGHEHAEGHAARLAGLLLFALAAYVVVIPARDLYRGRGPNRDPYRGPDSGLCPNRGHDPDHGLCPNCGRVPA